MRTPHPSRRVRRLDIAIGSDIVRAAVRYIAREDPI